DLRREQQIRTLLNRALGVKKRKTTYRLEPSVGPLAFSQAAHRAVSAWGHRMKGSDIEEPPYRETGDGRDAPLHVWDLKTMNEPRVFHGHTFPIACVDMTTDGTRALSGSSGRLLRLWNLDSGACLHVLRGHRGIVFDCALTY